RTEGQTRSKLNLLYACFEALQKLMQFKLSQKDEKTLSVVEGSSKVVV
ncbi:30S ribosomal protein S5, partial [Candidatus Woesearchaeota archaeon]|nr:30S ribosomal protein S5 [Candidatus Woesearchaeota archaeon]